MSTTATPAARPAATKEKIQRLDFYGYNYHEDAAGRFLGEARAGSNAYFVFASKQAFEQAVTEYNILGRTPVQSASLGRA